jgi:hypothetical protein
MIKTFRHFILLLSGIVMVSGSLKAQFSISGEFRPRLEYRDGYARLRDSSQTPYLDILGRNRLVFDYKNEQFSAKFSIQHAYVFGENNFGSDTITRNTVNIYEGWFRYSFTRGFAMKIGRTELIYDDARLFGNSNWSARGTSHDVGMLQWESGKRGYRGDFGFAINNAAPPGAFLASYTLKNYKYMGYLYEQKKFFKDQLTVSVLAILDVFQKPGSTSTLKTTKKDTLYVIGTGNDTIGTTVVTTSSSSTVTTNYPTQLYGRFTFGGTATWIRKNLKVFAAGYYQAGHLSDGRELSAGMAGGYASYRVVKPLTLLLGYEYISGNDYSSTDLKTKSTSFSTLYGTSHGFYGYMDLFAVQVVGGNSAGLTDLWARGTVQFTGKTSLEATWRMFGLAKGYLPITPKKAGDATYVAVDKNLGSEIDLMFVYKPFNNFEVNAAYCFFLPTSSMEQLNGLKAGTSRWAQYAYVMLTYKPAFFNSEKH